MIQQVKCNINFFHRQYNCLTLLLCCIFFLFFTNSQAEEILSDNEKTEVKESGSNLYVVNGTSVANIDQIQGVKEVKYVKSKKHKAPKAKKQKTSPKINAIASIQAPDTPKREENTFLTIVSPVNKKNSLISSSSEIVAAITVSGKISKKYKKVADIQPFHYHQPIAELKVNIVEEASILSFPEEEQFLQSCRMRPPPVC